MNSGAAAGQIPPTILFIPSSLLFSLHPSHKLSSNLINNFGFKTPTACFAAFFFLYIYILLFPFLVHFGLGVPKYYKIQMTLLIYNGCEKFLCPFFDCAPCTPFANPAPPRMQEVENEFFSPEFVHGKTDRFSQRKNDLVAVLRNILNYATRNGMRERQTD